VNILSKKLWKGIAIGGIASFLIMNLLQERSHQEHKSSKNNSKEDMSMLDDSGFEEKISIIQERMQELSPENKSD
jgi:hypothetical protein